MELSPNFQKLMRMAEGATKEGLDALLENYKELKKDLTWTPLPSGEDVWEAGKKNGQKIKEKVE